MRAEKKEVVSSPSSKVIISMILGQLADFDSHLLHHKHEVQNKTTFSPTVVQLFSVVFSLLGNPTRSGEKLSCLGSKAEDSGGEAKLDENFPRGCNEQRRGNQ